MTTVAFFRNGERLEGFRAKGHSGYAEAGEDIVCAAVSALCQTAELGIRKVARASASVRRDDAEALFSVRLGDNGPQADAAAQIILRTLEEGILDIEAQYSGFVRTTYTERRQIS